MMKLFPISSRKDNYIWALVNIKNNNALIVDPGEAKPVIDWLAENNYQLTDIFITHHHPDHIDGLAELINVFSPNVYTAEEDQILGTTTNLVGGENIKITSLGLNFKALSIPGHTQNHLAFYAEPYLFCGDTLFSVGCGRVLGGTLEQLYDSLQELKQLPDDTLVCAAHEYTLSNIRFAQFIEPSNSELNHYAAYAKALREELKPSLPSTIGIEKAVNPFLRTDQPDLQQAISAATNQPITNSLSAFKALRGLKDNF